jgi:hypothetical protein
MTCSWKCKGVGSINGVSGTFREGGAGCGCGCGVMSEREGREGWLEWIPGRKRTFSVCSTIVLRWPSARNFVQS